MIPIAIAQFQWLLAYCIISTVLLGLICLSSFSYKDFRLTSFYSQFAIQKALE